MIRRKTLFPVLFVIIMLIFTVFVAWFLPSVSNLRFRLQDTQISLETSHGRERKQQHEYDETVADLHTVREELAQLQPQIDQAEADTKELKAERKELRRRLKELQSMTSSEGAGSDE